MSLQTIDSHGVHEIKNYAIDETGLPNKVTQILAMIKCVVKCFVETINKNQKSISRELETKIQMSSGKVSKIEMKVIYKVFKCSHNCIVGRPITDWQSFSHALYCFTDTFPIIESNK
ncbi:unnamed protein product [Medioppia subpectinata]|uniref:Uncharacterized protein n=1 Tax=Medioppia subpectinata TaxID=1979941 RepID=A0A7R9KFV8_9ACAR|nr:unnamed protein product [Medioppia subpectinata]CAG2101815.1 unnamed protein product [Medioppia subpectinata]